MNEKMSLYCYKEEILATFMGVWEDFNRKEATWGEDEKIKRKVVLGGIRLKQIRGGLAKRRFVTW